MLNCWCVAKIWIVLVIVVEDIFGLPQDGNKTKSRILTHPPKFEYGEEQEIVFPDDSEEKIDIVSRIGVNPQCADGLPFCEEVDAYPYNHLKRVLQQNPMLKVLFGQDEGPPQGIANRIGDDDEKFICRSIVKTIFPKYGQNKNNKWKFIINQGEDDGFIQGVQIEVCKNPDGECDIPGSLITSGYQTLCKQKYVYRRLLSISNEGTPIPDTFKLPSACCCAYKQSLDFLSRFGRDYTPASETKS